VVGLITTFMARHAPGFWWSLISALIGIAAGIVLLAWPLSGAVSLTLVLIVFFTIEGIASIMFAIDHRRQLSGQWMWMLVSGIVDLILAGIIFAGLPENRALGARIAGRHQLVVRRRRDDRNGAARAHCRLAESDQVEALLSARPRESGDLAACYCNGSARFLDFRLRGNERRTVTHARRIGISAASRRRPPG
jgi:hypothetical protein